MSANNEVLMKDIKNVVSDTEELLEATKGQKCEKVDKIRDRLKENVSLTKEKMKDFEEILAEKTKETARATDNYVHENPWKSIGIAAGVGVVLGIILGKK